MQNENDLFNAIKERIKDAIEVPQPKDLLDLLRNRKEYIEKFGIALSGKRIGKCNQSWSSQRTKPAKEDKEAILCMNQVVTVDHPVLAKVLDYGNGTAKLNQGKVVEIIDQLYANPSSDVAMDLAAELREAIKEQFSSFVAEQLVKYEKGIRPAMMPGSVSNKELLNLYYGDESYSLKDTYGLASSLIESTGVGQSISIYFYGEFGTYIRQKASSYGSKHFSADGIGSNNFENSLPYVELIRLLDFIYQEAGSDEKERVKTMMQEASGLIYVTPGKDRDEYSTYVIPSLRTFVNNWLFNDKNRSALSGLLKQIYIAASIEYKKRGGADSQIKVLYNTLEFACQSLIEIGSFPPQALREIADLLVEIGSEGGVWLQPLANLTS
ncbi:hypothetical protein [Tardisphaera saccharovorans]